MSASLLQINGASPANVRAKVVTNLKRRREYKNTYDKASKVRFIGPVLINADRRV